MAEKSSSLSEEMSAASNSSIEDKQESLGGWWDSWVSSAKTKSAEVYTMVKKDLTEISSAVKSEASHVYNTTSTVIGNTLKLDEPESPANVMKKSFSTFIGQVSTVLNPEPDDDDTEVILSTGDTTMLSTYKKELESLQRVDATFIVPASGPEFDAWKATLEPGAPIVSANTAVKRLQQQPVLSSQYDKLVPDAVSHDEFWERYLFRVALLQDRLAAMSRKQPIDNSHSDPVLAHLPIQGQVESTPEVSEASESVASALEVSSPTPEVLDGAVAWDDDFASDVELTEEQQTLLLQEYEKEIANKKQKTTTKDLTNNNSKTLTVNNDIDTELTNMTLDKHDTKTKSVTNRKRNIKTSRKNSKSDICGNNLVENYFEDSKDDASSNSDESWEKDFDVNEETAKA